MRQDLPLVELISGLARPSAAEHLFLEALGKSIAISLYERLNADSLKRCRSGVPLVLVIPVLGDNDLHAAHFELLTMLSRAPVFATKQIVVVLHGDRHVWDVSDGADPVDIKLRNLFYFSHGVHCPADKLDVDTVASITQQILPHLSMARSQASTELASIAMLLGKAPMWDEERRLLDFYDPATGFSLLYGQTPELARRAFGHAMHIGATTLRLTNAALTQGYLADLSFSARRIDLNGNALAWCDAVRAFPRMEWVSMAANNLSSVDLANSPPTLEHVYLHKNAIEYLHLPARLPCKIQELSLYRNRLHQVDLPDDQRALKKLNLGANPIASLPDGLRNAHELRFLGIARTNIRSLPAWLRDLKSLRQLDISHIEHALPIGDLDALTERGIDIIRKPGYSS